MPVSETYGSTTLPQGSRVVVVVSKGPSGVTNHSYATMPDVVAKSQGAALEAIAQEHLQTQVIYDFHPTARKGSVTATLPQGGVSVPVGSEALILVSSGPALGDRPPVELVDVTGMHESEAIGALNSAGLSPQIFYVHNDVVPQNYVVEQLPNKTTYAQKTNPSKIINWALIAVLALALAIGGYLMLSDSSPWSIISSPSSKAEVKAPELQGLSVAAATARLQRAGLEVGDVTEEFAQGVPVGQVVRCFYQGKEVLKGDSVPKGSKIDLVISAGSSGEELVSVPDVTDMTEARATKELVDKGFVVIVTKNADDTIEAGQVINTSPSPGSRVERGAEIEMIVSTGPMPESVEVPDIIGIDEAAAKTALENVGLEIRVTKSASTSVSEGMVIKCSPNVGAEVDAGSSVVVVISTGSSTANVPDVIGATVEQAREVLESAGFVSKVSPATASGEVVRQSPTPNTQAKKGSTVIIYAE